MTGVDDVTARNNASATVQIDDATGTECEPFQALFSCGTHVLEAGGVADEFVIYNQRGVELAVEARVVAGVDDVVVAGGISNWTWSGPHPSSEVPRRNTAEQAAAMKDGGADLLMLEMMIDIDRMRATLDGAGTSVLPIWVGLTCGSEQGLPFASTLPWTCGQESLGVRAQRRLRGPQRGVRRSHCSSRLPDVCRAMVRARDSF